MDIGARLRQLREQQGLTQDQVGLHVGVNKTTVQRYESGNIDIKRTVAIKLAEVLHTNPPYIMGWSDISSPPDSVTPVPSSPLRDTLLDSFDHLNQEGQQRLVETADDMVASGKYVITDPPSVAQIAAKGGDGVQTIPLTPQQAEAAKKVMEELPD